MSYLNRNSLNDKTVKNKAAAEIQITAEQLIREAVSRSGESQAAKKPTYKISSDAELDDYKLKKRKEFETAIIRKRMTVGVWLKYADFEDKMNELPRARSIYERGLAVLPCVTTLWLRYADMELRNKAVNHARNILDRAVTMLPRISQFWLKYTYIEESLQNVAGCRRVFERWTATGPEKQAWLSFIKFELRHNEVDNARALFERFIVAHCEPASWIKYAKFEVAQRKRDSAREIYERACGVFDEDEAGLIAVLKAFASFEQHYKEFERVRALYQYGLERFGKAKAKDLHDEYVMFEKRHGDKKEIEDLLIEKRRRAYEEELADQLSAAAAQIDCRYDTWFEYIKLEEAYGTPDSIRTLYERAIAQIPRHSSSKADWARYVYLWIYYACYEELTTRDYERTREIYKTILGLIPHASFTFARVWILSAKFEIRRHNLPAYRKIMGRALGLAPKPKLFKAYLDLEMELRAFDRCRKIFEAHIKYDPANSATWIAYAELETALNDLERARAVFEMGLNVPGLQLPELLWKAYIDFEAENLDHDRVRALYQRLVERTQHLKAYLAYANFEIDLIRSTEHSTSELEKIRSIYTRANRFYISTAGSGCTSADRAQLLEAWHAFEQEFGTDESIASVCAKLPTKVTRVKETEGGDGAISTEEYTDWVFPDEQSTQKPKLSFLTSIKSWKQAKTKEDTHPSPL